MAFQPVRGISADHVTNIPEQWSKSWFRGFIRNHLEQMDVRNAVAGPGIAITSAAAQNSHTLLARGKISSGSGAPISSLEPIPAHNTLGNPTGTSAPPVAMTQAQLTALVNPFSASLSGAAPASSGGTATFLRADGAWVIPAYPVGANPSALVGLTAVNGVAATYMRSDGAPALDPAISPTWSGSHTFSLSVKFTLGIGVNGNTAPAQVTGFGTPTGTGVIANFPGATATLAQATQAIAQLIADLKAIGFYGT